MMYFKKCVLLAALPAMLVSCGGEKADNAATQDDPRGWIAGKGDFSQPLVCDVENGTRRNIDESTLRDPVAEFLMRTGDCPTTHHDMVEKFQKLHQKEIPGAEGEESTFQECDRAVESYVVSETAQIQGTEDDSRYRVVVTRECGETKRHELLWSLFGVSGKGENWRIPQGAGIELIAYDDTAGVYNYYEMNGSGFTFHGDSKDIKNGTAGRCAGCHVGGGLIMKELDTPWLHWEGHEDVPGAKDLVTNNADLLGFKGTGSTFEGITKRGNEQYNEARAEWMLFEANAQEILHPLFCSPEVNLDNATDFKDRNVDKIPGDFFLDRRFASFSRKLAMTNDAYEAILEETGSHVEDVNGDHTDTIFKFAFPERSHIDDDFVKTLISGVDIEGTNVKVLDDELANDVLAVDFTRPIFNAERCALLQFVPDVDFIAGMQAGGMAQDPPETGTNGATNGASGPGEVNFADEIRSGLIANLEASNPAADSHAGQLLTALQDAEDNHDERIDAFFTACNARDKTEMMRDVARVNSVYRRLAMAESAFEEPNVMATDNLNEPQGIRFNPETCIAE